MKLSEYTPCRAEALYRIALPETGQSPDMKLLWFDNMNRTDIERRINPDTHSHSFFEIHFIVSGSIRYEIEGDTVEVSESHALLIAPETAHRYMDCSGQLHKATAAFSASGAFEEVLRNVPASVFDFPENVVENIDFMLKSSEGADALTPVIIYGRLYELIRSAFEALEITIPEARPRQTDPRVLTAMEFIEKNISRKIGCVEVAGECCLSPKQIGRVFKSSTGVSIYDYITECRIKQAKRLLFDGGMSIKEIAYALGFSTQSSFTSFFKRHCGVSPGDFRQW